MEGLLSVSVGTVFWASISFIIVFFLLYKMAWNPILKSLKDREEGISNALNEAERARQEMAKLQAGNEDLLRQARDERDNILKDAKAVADKMRAEALAKTQADADRMLAAARAEIENQKNAAITELKNSVATLSVDIAEKLVREKLTDADKQKALNQSMAADFSAN
ncbi:MAG: F0F1 ATP synthase subunit B [Flavobacteriales bacterium]|jgi:F-type H+-transporting ATPase subunit b